MGIGAPVWSVSPTASCASPQPRWVDVPLAETTWRDGPRSTPRWWWATTPTSVRSPERLRGSAMGAANVVYLSGQVGVGGGIVIDGTLLKGRRGTAARSATCG